MESRVKCAVCAVAMCLVLRAGSGMEHKFRYYTDNSGCRRTPSSASIRMTRGMSGSARPTASTGSTPTISPTTAPITAAAIRSKTTVFTVFAAKGSPTATAYGSEPATGSIFSTRRTSRSSTCHPGQRWPGAPQPAGLFACGGRRGQHVDRDARRRPLPLQPQERHVRTL